MESNMWKAALFDLDGVVFDTEPIYSRFWGAECRRYHPELPGLEQRIKGQTLTQILDGWFGEYKDEHSMIIERLNAFESQMPYVYVPGFEPFILSLRAAGIATAVVTSSNRKKMEAVYRAHPEVEGWFDRILTSEDFTESKPSPECYLVGAAALGAEPSECVVFEDSINGLHSGMASGAKVVGLSTTNPAETVGQLSHLVVPDFRPLTLADCLRLVAG